MGSRKHKKHHKSDKREKTPEAASTSLDRSAEVPLRLVLKVGGAGGSASEHGESPHGQPSSYPTETYVATPVVEATREEDGRTPGTKHKKSKKSKKKKKSSDRERRHRHHHHHRHDDDRKRKRGDREEFSPDESRASFVEGAGDDSLPEPPLLSSSAAFRQAAYEDAVSGHPREPRACTLKSRLARSPLQQLLEHLLRGLEQRDPQQFFAWPVTDHIAPGYSSIIARPMDFSTMRGKIDNREYSHLEQFRADLKLLCDNAMTYNHPETIYHRSAKRMLHAGMKSISKLSLLRTALPYLKDIGNDVLGFDVGGATSVEEPCRAPPPPVAAPVAETEMADPVQAAVPAAAVAEESVANEVDAGVVADGTPPDADVDVKPKISIEPAVPVAEVKRETGEDGLTPEEILSQARKAARAAADTLSLRRPNCKFGFLRQHTDGSTSLAILNPPGRNRENGSRKVCLEMLVGRLHHGSGSIGGYREDRRNVAKPVNYLNYGNYASYAPSNDSTFANLTKEDSDLLYATYGDETGVQFAESLLNFAKDCDFVSEMADGILNALTDDEHMQVNKLVESKKKKVESELLTQPQDGPALADTPPRKKSKRDELVQSPDFDMDSLKSLTDEGIDMSFLDELEMHLQKDPIQKKLDETTSLLQDLAKVQNARLKQKVPHHLAHVPGPSAEELQLAAKVTEKLTELSRKATPADLVSLSCIRDAMGISDDPPLQTATPPGGTDVAGVVSSSPTVAAVSVVNGANLRSLPHATVKMETEDDLSRLNPCGIAEVSSIAEDSDAVGDLEVELREFLETGTPIRESSLSPGHHGEPMDTLVS